MILGRLRMPEELFGQRDQKIVRTLSSFGVNIETSLPAGDGSKNLRQAWWRSFLTGPKLQTPASSELLAIVDLFSGCGGLALGIAEAAKAVGRTPVFELAADVDEGALEVHRANLGTKEIRHTSVASMIDFEVLGTGSEAEFAYPPEPIDEALEALVGKVDILCAGPPCQGHSNLNNHSRRADPRNLLYLTVPAIAVAVGAKRVIVENVPDVRHDHHGVVETAIRLFETNGYRVSEMVWDAAEFGWPQRRRRFFLIATLGEQIVAENVRSALLAPAAGVFWAISDLEDMIGNDAFSGPATLNEDNVARIDWLFERDEYNLANEVRPDCHKDGHTYPSVYGRLRPDEPSGTVTTGFMTPGRGRYVHPTRRRVITAHEAARIQGFPDWWQFSSPRLPEPTRKMLSKWIGDAVPSILGYATGLAALTGDEVGSAKVDAAAA
jgi:DNA (cytosine-5)-methyltransferase 1